MPCETIFSLDQAMLCVLGVIVVDEPIDGESTYILGLPAKLEPSEGANISARCLLPKDSISIRLITECNYFRTHHQAHRMVHHRLLALEPSLWLDW